jgi:hypothetical protein
VNPNIAIAIFRPACATRVAQRRRPEPQSLRKIRRRTGTRGMIGVKAQTIGVNS